MIGEPGSWMRTPVRTERSEDDVQAAKRLEQPAAKRRASVGRRAVNPSLSAIIEKPRPVRGFFDARRAEIADQEPGLRNKKIPHSRSPRLPPSTQCCSPTFIFRM